MFGSLLRLIFLWWMSFLVVGVRCRRFILMMVVCLIRFMYWVLGRFGWCCWFWLVVVG